MNTVIDQVKMCLEEARKLVLIQDSQLEAGVDYTDKILALVNQSRGRLLLCEHLDKIDVRTRNAIEVAIISIEMRTFDFSNRLGKGAEEAERSIRIYNQSLHYLANVQDVDTQLVIKIYHYTVLAKAFAQQVLSLFDAAIHNYEIAASFFKREFYSQEWSEIKYHLGFCLHYSEPPQIEAAIEQYQFALTVMEEKARSGLDKDKRKLAFCYMLLTECFKRKLDKDGGVVNFKKASHYADLSIKHLEQLV